MAKKNGFTLIETLVASAVLVIFIAAVLTIVQMIVQAIGEARVRSMAIQLAQDQIEITHNLDYEQIGTINGIPAGALEPEQQVDRQGTHFAIRTSVLYIDDDYDGKAPEDVVPTDYKRVRVAVTWEGLFSSRLPVVMMMDVSPPGLESDVGGGTLSVLVFDARGTPISNAAVQIQAPTLSPPVEVETFTDATGRISVPGAPTCTGCYLINVSKEGYTSDRTYSTSEVANPAKPQVSILQGRVSEISFAIDVLSTLTVKATRAKTSDYAPFAGVNLTLTGTKEIGRTADDEPVYKVVKSITTSTGGAISVPNLEWDRYTISVPSNSSVDMAGSWPFNPVPVEPGQSTQATVVVVAASDNTLLVQLEDSAHQPLTEAQVEITSPSYIATGSTGLASYGDYSQAFFPGLLPETYTLTMSSPGFEAATASVALSGDLVEKFILSAP